MTVTLLTVFAFQMFFSSNFAPKRHLIYDRKIRKYQLKPYLPIFFKWFPETNFVEPAHGELNIAVTFLFGVCESHLKRK